MGSDYYSLIDDLEINSFFSTPNDGPSGPPSFWDTVDIDDFLTVDWVRYCPNCMLVYKPDPRQHMKPNLYCPRCGYKLVKDVRDEFEEHRQPGGGTDGGSGAKFY